MNHLLTLEEQNKASNIISVNVSKEDENGSHKTSHIGSLGKRATLRSYPLNIVSYFSLCYALNITLGIIDQKSPYI